MHGKVVYLTNRWDDYLVRWDRLEQQGWGSEAKFDPARVTGFQLAARVQDLPADFWIDDVSFVTQAEVVALEGELRSQPPPPIVASAVAGAKGPAVAASGPTHKGP